MKYIITRVFVLDDNREHAVFNGDDSCIVWDGRPSVMYDNKTEIDEMRIELANLRERYPETDYKLYSLKETTL
jgi:hypothetical protein